MNVGRWHEAREWEVARIGGERPDGCVVELSLERKHGGGLFVLLDAEDAELLAEELRDAAFLIESREVDELEDERAEWRQEVEKSWK